MQSLDQINETKEIMDKLMSPTIISLIANLLLCFSTISVNDILGNNLIELIVKQQLTTNYKYIFSGNTKTDNQTLHIIFSSRIMKALASLDCELFRDQLILLSKEE